MKGHKMKGYKNLIVGIAVMGFLFILFSYFSLLREVTYLKSERTHLLKLVLKQRELQSSLFEENSALKEKASSKKERLSGNAGFLLKQGN